MSRVVRRPAADQDLVAAYRYYARQAGQGVADRFFAEAEATVARLAAKPGIGAVYEPAEPLYSNVRYSRISRFRNYLVFYLPLSEGIEVLRVLHAARDIDGILSDEFGGEDRSQSKTN